MTKIDNPLEGKYEGFLNLIEILCSCYDETEKDIISLSISTAVRVLVHDTNKSVSLLTHLGKKDVEFISTNFVNDRDTFHFGLVREINTGVKDGSGGKAKNWPLCDERYFPSPREKHRIPFKQWWGSEEIFRDNSILTRSDLVLSMANKDGGAHFDTKVQKNYDDFRYKWSGGSGLIGTKSGIARGRDNIPVYPAMRQIGYEILCTLKP